MQVYKPFIAGIIHDLANKIPPKEIPGQVNIYSVRVAHPDEMVTNGQYANEEEAKKKLADSLRYYPEFLSKSAFSVDTSNLVHYLRRKYTHKGLEGILKQLEARADEISPLPPVTPSMRIGLYKEIDKARLNGDISQSVATDLGFEVAKCAGDPKLEELVQTKLMGRISEAEEKRGQSAA